MTAQSPERIILGDRLRTLYADPLGPLLEARRIDIHQYSRGVRSSCWRGYTATWDIREGQLRLVHLNVVSTSLKRNEDPMPTPLRARLLRATSQRDFPIPALWFSGRLRVTLGRRLVASHHGWSHWFERERVITIANGTVIRDREVDTRAILEWHLKRRPELAERLAGKKIGLIGALMWFDNSEDRDDRLDDWWPPDYGKAEYEAQNRSGSG